MYERGLTHLVIRVPPRKSALSLEMCCLLRVSLVVDAVQSRVLIYHMQDTGADPRITEASK